MRGLFGYTSSLKGVVLRWLYDYIHVIPFRLKRTSNYQVTYEKDNMYNPQIAFNCPFDGANRLKYVLSRFYICGMPCHWRMDENGMSSVPEPKSVRVNSSSYGSI